MRKILLLASFSFISCALILSCTNSSPDNGDPTPLNLEFDVDSNTLALWHINETAGQTLYDSSGNNYHLFLGADDTVEVIDPTLIDSGRSGFGYCILTDGGQTQYAYGDHSLPLSTNNSLTIECWIKTSTLGWGVLLKTGNICFDVSKNDSEHVYFEVGDGLNGTSGVAPSPTLSDGYWHYIACSYNYTSQTQKIYVDGSEVFTNTPVNRAVPNTSPINVGGRPSNTFFTGYIDEIRISNIARTPTEISNHYTQATQQN